MTIINDLGLELKENGEELVYLGEADKMKKIKVLKITDMHYSKFNQCNESEQVDVFKGKEIESWFDDNGSAPEGNLWIISGIDEEDEDVMEAIELGAEIIKGYYFDDVIYNEVVLEWFHKYAETDWAGLSGSGCWFFVDKIIGVRFRRISNIYNQAENCFEYNRIYVEGADRSGIEIKNIDDDDNKIIINEVENGIKFDFKIVNSVGVELMNYEPSKRIVEFRKLVL